MKNRDELFPNGLAIAEGGGHIPAPILINLWLTLQTNIPKTWRANTTWTTSALTATCAAKPRRTISSAMTTAATRSSTNSRQSPEEEARCKEAKEGCPVEAIGDNGA